MIDYIPLSATAARRTTTAELRALARERMRRLGYPYVATEFVAPAGAIQRWELDRDIGLIEYGHPAFERMLANRRFGFTVRPDDALRSSRPARRLQESVGDAAWLALLETIAFGRTLPLDEPTFEHGAGI